MAHETTPATHGAATETGTPPHAAPSQPADWRAGLPDELKPTAERFNSPADAVKAVADLRRRESTAIRIPGKDARPEEIAAYRKAMAVPETADAYLKLFPAPTPGEPPSEAVVARRAAWAKRFHDANVPAPVADALIRALGEDIAQDMQAIAEADRKYVADATAALEKKWGPAFPVNKTFADRGFAALAEKAGVDMDALLKLETKGGAYLMDHPDIVQIFAAVGREMDEGSLGPAASADQRTAIDSQLREVRARIEIAQANRDTKEANRLYQVEQSLIAKASGSRPIVGAHGRPA